MTLSQDLHWLHTPATHLHSPSLTHTRHLSLGVSPHWHHTHTTPRLWIVSNDQTTPPFLPPIVYAPSCLVFWSVYIIKCPKVALRCYSNVILLLKITNNNNCCICVFEMSEAAHLALCLHRVQRSWSQIWVSGLLFYCEIILWTKN